MAGKGKAGSEGNGASAGSNGASFADSPPAGFRRQSSVSDAPWVSLEAGNVCYGKLINRYPMNGQDPPRHYYQVELKAPCKVRQGRGDDAEVVEAKAGDVVNLNENHKTMCLCDVVIPEIVAGAEFEIWAKIENKISLKGSRTMWNIDVQTKQLRAPTAPIRVLDNAGGSVSEEAPF